MKLFCYRSSAVLFTLLLSTQALYAQEFRTPEISNIPVANSAINIDGNLDDAAWQNAARLPLPYEWFPGDNTPSPVETTCYITYDRDALYIAFHAFDPNPAEIRAHLMDRDAIATFVQDDHVGVIIDTFNDERRGFQFRLNPLGVQADAFFSELEGSEEWNWDAIWDSAGQITNDGYIVEMAVPFSSLRFPDTAQIQTWGFEAFRSYPRTVRHRIRSYPTNRNRNCLLCQMDKIQGFENITPGNNIELTPTVTTSRTDVRENDALATGDIEPEFGFTGKWGITPNLILNATINPDFSQVEADVAQLAVNNRFALFFPEKRPFFLEGADFFLTPLQAVFTRTIADPIGGLKMTGKEGDNALGLFITRDRINQLTFPSNQTSGSTTEERDVNGAVLRYRRDIGRNSTLGVLYTGRLAQGEMSDAEDYSNHVFGVDGFVRLSSNNTLQFQALRSETNYAETTALNAGQPTDGFGDLAFSAAFQHVSRNWFGRVSYEDLGRDFRSDAGFIPRVDTREAEAGIARIFRGSPDRWYSQINVSAGLEATYDHDGTLTDQVLGAGIFYTGALQSQVSLNAEQAKTFFAGETYDITRGSIFLQFQPSGVAQLRFFVRYGDEIDVFNRRLGTGILLQPSAELKLGRHLNVRLLHTLQRLAVPEGRLFTANLLQGNIRYQFNTRMFVRAILQYRVVDRDETLYGAAADQPAQRSLFTQLLFSYKINPQTVLFLGYSDNYGRDAATLDLLQLNRTFFFKVGYAWLL